MPFNPPKYETDAYNDALKLYFTYAYIVVPDFNCVKLSRYPSYVLFTCIGI